VKAAVSGLGVMNKYMKFAMRLILILIVLISCVGCDQATKSIAVSHLSTMETLSYLGDTIRLQLAYNRGAFLSMGHSLPGFLRYSIFTVGTCFILLGALTFALLSKSCHFYVILAISLFIAGGVGNLIDRILHDGTVVGFINVGIGSLRTGIFNIADVAIMGGAALLFFTTLRKQKLNR
jgi:signal peptidase II